jgi:NCAIR mutase (PurE)-related protein
MQQSDIEKLLTDFHNGDLQIEDVIRRLRDLPFENLEFAHVDHHRQLRQGFPEVIFCKGKSTEQIVEIARSIVEREMPLIATHAEKDVADNVRRKIPAVKYNIPGRVLYSEPKKIASDFDEKLIIITAGTADIPVAEEAWQSAYVMGFQAKKLYDVGVAGIHRILSYRRLLSEAAVIIVIAGMEGALPSVVGGITPVPLIAVPTSTGYGTSFGGITALLAMLNSCSNGITVVNIDNGFGAAAAAVRMMRQFVGNKVISDTQDSKP